MSNNHPNSFITLENDGVYLISDPVVSLSNSRIGAMLNLLLPIMGKKSLRVNTMSLWCSIIRAFTAVTPPMTVRQMYYALVSMGAIEKTETAYKKVTYHLLRMRRLNIIPYSFIADHTRWMRKPTTYNGMQECLQITAQTYRRSLWAEMDKRVEIWLEKDALAGVIYPITENYDVPLMVTRGFPSETFLFEAAEAIKDTMDTKHSFIYFLGDHDPSGRSIADSTERKLREFGAEFTYEHLAVLPWQVQAWNLPTRPTKKTDSRAKNWEGGSVELDAVPVQTLRNLCTQSISQHIDELALKQLQRIEAAERKTLMEVQANWG